MKNLVVKLEISIVIIPLGDFLFYLGQKLNIHDHDKYGFIPREWTILFLAKYRAIHQ